MWQLIKKEDCQNFNISKFLLITYCDLKSHTYSYWSKMTFCYTIQIQL